jgi:hypothetical protein
MFAAVTKPAFDTDAIPAFDDCHVAEFDTLCVVPSDMVAVTVNWLVCPTVMDINPLTSRPVTVVGEDGVVGEALPHEMQRRTTNAEASAAASTLGLPRKRLLFGKAGRQNDHGANRPRGMVVSSAKVQLQY